MRERVLVREGPVFPQSCIVRFDGHHRLGDESLDHAQQRLSIVDDDAWVRGERVKAQNHLAHEIVLLLNIGRVADSYRLRSTESLEVVEVLFDELALATDAI